MDKLTESRRKLRDGEIDDPPPDPIDHQHQWGLRVDGMATCRAEGCDATDYDSQWGAGIFTDWPRGTSKPYGA